LDPRAGLDTVDAKKSYRNSLCLKTQLEGTYSFGPLDMATEKEGLHLIYVGFHVIYLKMETKFNSENLRF
jgi:hypothetical protein